MLYICFDITGLVIQQVKQILVYTCIVTSMTFVILWESCVANLDEICMAGIIFPPKGGFYISILPNHLPTHIQTHLPPKMKLKTKNEMKHKQKMNMKIDMKMKVNKDKKQKHKQKKQKQKLTILLSKT